MVTRGSERNVARDGRNMENPKKGKCHIPRKEHGESKEGQVPHTQEGTWRIQRRASATYPEREGRKEERRKGYARWGNRDGVFRSGRAHRRLGS